MLHLEDGSDCRCQVVVLQRRLIVVAYSQRVTCAYLYRQRILSRCCAHKVVHVHYESEGEHCNMVTAYRVPVSQARARLVVYTFGSLHMHD